MNILSETMFDDKLHSGEWFSIYKEDELPEGFVANQDRLIRNIETLLSETYSEDEIFVSNNLWASESLKIDVQTEVISVRFIECLAAFLRRNADTYTICGGVYDDLFSGKTYRGRYIVGSAGIVAIEQTLTAKWAEKMNSTHQP